MSKIERPILFSGEMVRAILDGRKTQTRRVVKQREVNAAISRGILSGTNPAFGPCPFGEPSDRLWVRETFGLKPKRYCGDKVLYRADGEQKAWAWRPSIHMPRWASRLTLEVTGVRVDRLQQITDADARAEGCCGVASTQWGMPNFRHLWDSLNAKRGLGWNQNPWVWVVEFKRL